MGIFTTDKVMQKCLYTTEDLKGTVVNLEIKRDLIRKMRNGECVEAWPFDPDLLIQLKINKHDYGDVYPINSRDGIFDPLGITGDRWGKLWAHIKGTATEEQKAVGSKKAKSALEKATMPLSIAAGIMIVALTLMAMWGYYADKVVK